MARRCIVVYLFTCDRIVPDTFLFACMSIDKQIKTNDIISLA